MDLEFSIGEVLGAGAIATLVMTAIMYMVKAMMPRQMTMDILYTLGSMMTLQKVPAYVMGSMMHAGAGIVFAIIHVALFVSFDFEDNLWAWGLLFGAAHWMIMGMMMGSMHPRMKSGDVQSPGFFVSNFPMPNVMGFLMVHLVYGVLVGALYEAFIKPNGRARAFQT